MFDSIVRAVSEHKQIVIAATAVVLLVGYISPLGQAIAQLTLPDVNVDPPNVSVGLDDNILVDIDDYEISVVVDGISVNVPLDDFGGGFFPA